MQASCEDTASRKQAIKEAFRRTDAEVLAKAEQAHWQDGATCVAVWISGDTAMVANVGGAYSFK